MSAKRKATLNGPVPLIATTTQSVERGAARAFGILNVLVDVLTSGRESSDGYEPLRRHRS
jgi:hypothetical protein